MSDRCSCSTCRQVRSRVVYALTPWLIVIVLVVILSLAGGYETL